MIGSSISPTLDALLVPHSNPMAVTFAKLLPDPSVGSPAARIVSAHRHVRSADAGAKSLANLPLASRTCDLSTGEWDELFNAVKSRLLLTVGERLTLTAGANGPGSAGWARVSVLECVDALEQLHALLRLERARRPPQ
jgi:hypothetical protein